MKSLEIGNTAVDLQAQENPFNPGATVVAVNSSAESRVLQGSVDEAFTSPVTIATLAAAGVTGCIQTITPTLQYIRVSTGGGDVVTLLGN